MYCGYISVFCKQCLKPIGLDIMASQYDNEIICALTYLDKNISKGFNNRDGIEDINNGIEDLTNGITTEQMWPPMDKPHVSTLMPSDVRKCMFEAEQALIARDIARRIARGAFRTVLDVATKEVLRQNPGCLGDTMPKNLSNRIDMLAKAGLLTTDLKDWAHGVRGITNEDVHTVESVSKEEAQEIAEITRLILTYLFELPERVKLAKAAAEDKKAKGNG